MQEIAQKVSVDRWEIIFALYFGKILCFCLVFWKDFVSLQTRLETDN